MALGQCLPKVGPGVWAGWGIRLGPVYRPLAGSEREAGVIPWQL